MSAASRVPHARDKALAQGAGGSGCWFTFGRAHWWMNTGAFNGFLCVPPADDDAAYGTRRFEIQFNFEPSRRLRFYQFDPMHHDVAIYSIH